MQWGREEDEQKEGESSRTRTNAQGAGFMVFKVELVLLRLHESIRPLPSHLPIWESFECIHLEPGMGIENGEQETKFFFHGACILLTKAKSKSIVVSYGHNGKKET